MGQRERAGRRGNRAKFGLEEFCCRQGVSSSLGHCFPLCPHRDLLSFLRANECLKALTRGYIRQRALHPMAHGRVWVACYARRCASNVGSRPGHKPEQVFALQRSVLGSTREMRNWSTFSVWRRDGLAYAYPKHFGCGIGGRRLTEKRWRRRRGPIISIALQYGISHPLQWQQGRARYVGRCVLYCGIAVAQQHLQYCIGGTAAMTAAAAAWRTSTNHRPSQGHPGPSVGPSHAMDAIQSV